MLLDCLSESATKDLVKLLVSRGYFHRNVAPQLADADRTSNDAPQFSETDSACQLVTRRDGYFITKEQLCVRLMEELRAVGGRLSVDAAASILAVEPLAIEQISSHCIRVADDLIVEQYLDHMAHVTNVELVKQDGHMVVSELASAIWNMPMEIVLSVLGKQIESGMFEAKIMSIFGTKVLVTPTFEEREKRRIRGVFEAITLPTQVDFVCHGFQWDIAYVVPILRHWCNKGDLLGELHAHEGASLSGAMYIPNVYLSMQRQSVDELFASNGFITVEECLAMGVLESKMAEYIRETNPTATALAHSVISRDVIVKPVEQALIEAIANNSFLDLRIHLPVPLLEYEQDLKMIVEDMALPSVTAGGASKDVSGCTVISNGEALFVSQGMVRHIMKTLLPPLIESFAKSRAEEIKALSDETVSKAEEFTVEQSPKRKGRKSTKKAKAASSQTKENIQCGVVPLVTVAKAVASEYPDLVDVQTTVAPLIDEGDASEQFWEHSEVGGGPLYDVCRCVLYNDEFQSSCERAVRAELERLDSIKSSSSVRSRKDGAAKIRSVESAFEDPACFSAACYAVQEHTKFLKYVEALPDVDEKVMNMLKEDYLGGCCTEFASRITQFCLFRNEIEDSVFTIQKSDEENAGDNVDSALPHYCRPFDTAARQYPSTRLTCSVSDEDEQKLPLPTLRVVLSGGVGVQLTRLWTLCGGRYYDGGVIVNEDGTETVRQGSADGFLQVCNDNCLTIVGIPFKKIDKKSEKQYLFARRKVLTEQLEATNEPRAVLELTIMLLFQQAKNLVVSGPPLTGPILSLLKRERKISEAVAKQLQRLADAVNADVSPDETLVTSVKACGLSRDISKHTVTTFDVVDSQINCPSDVCCGALDHLT